MSLSRAILFPFLIDLFKALSGTVKLVGEKRKISNKSKITFTYLFYTYIVLKFIQEFFLKMAIISLLEVLRSVSSEES